jgi:hypothetical protein
MKLSSRPSLCPLQSPFGLVMVASSFRHTCLVDSVVPEWVSEGPVNTNLSIRAFTKEGHLDSSRE